MLNDILESLAFGGGGRADKKLQRLIERGERSTARVDGLRIVSKSDSADEWTWRLSVLGQTGEFITGVRQRLIPKEELVTLGTTLDVIHHDGRVAVDWPATIERLTGMADPNATIVPVKTRTDPPEPGIVDERLDRKRLDDGERTTATVLTVTDFEPMGMATQNKNIAVRLADGRDVLIKRALVPSYAVHLLSEGGRLPVAVDRKKPDKVSIDWPAAAAGRTS